MPASKRTLRLFHPAAGLTASLFVLAVSGSAAAADTIKVGILSSLSGTMAYEETPLKDMALMAIDDINAHGGVLGKKVEPVVTDPASNWPLFAEKALELLDKEKVAVVFGCWTSVSRKSVLPVFEERNGLLFYPVAYEGEEISRNVFYTGTVPSQQAVPAVEYLLSPAGGGAVQFVLVGTDYVHPRTTNKILRHFLHSRGVNDEQIFERYTPFGHSDYEWLVTDIKKFAARAPTAVVSMINGDSNLPFFRELQKQDVKPLDVPVLSLLVDEQQLLGSNLKAAAAGELSVASYFMSLSNPVNAAWKQQWAAYSTSKQLPDAAAPFTTEAMEATWIGVHLWQQAVTKARSTNVDRVIQAMAGQKFKAPDGLTVEMDAKNHHLHKPLFVAEGKADGQLDVVWKTSGLLTPQPWNPFTRENEKRKNEPKPKPKP